jgi:hypothetical protein
MVTRGNSRTDCTGGDHDAGIERKSRFVRGGSVLRCSLCTVVSRIAMHANIGNSINGNYWHAELL